MSFFRRHRNCDCDPVPNIDPGEFVLSHDAVLAIYESRKSSLYGLMAIRDAENIVRSVEV